MRPSRRSSPGGWHVQLLKYRGMGVSRRKGQEMPETKESKSKIADFKSAKVGLARLQYAQRTAATDQSREEQLLGHLLSTNQSRIKIPDMAYFCTTRHTQGMYPLRSLEWNEQGPDTQG